MSGWAQKRFWTDVSVLPEAGGFGVRLDDRPLRTPGKSPLLVPTPALAEAVADEWRAQDGAIDPLKMPWTRMANTAIEKIAPMMDEVAALVAEYGGSDLICYRAEGPDELVVREREWDQLLDWAQAEFDAVLIPTSGVMPVVQDAAALSRLHDEVRALPPFELAAFHDLVALSGSLILGFAVVRGHLPVAKAWGLSRIDETWQAEQWGVDDEALAAAEHREAEFAFAAAFFRLASKA